MAILIFQYEDDAIQPELSSPPCVRIQSGSPEGDGQRMEILVSIIGCAMATDIGNT